MKAKMFLVYSMATMTLLMGLGGCSESEAGSENPSATLKVYHFTNSGCLSNLRSDGTDDTTSLAGRHEVLRLKALGNGRLQIHHDSVVYQCAAKIELHVTRNGQLIHIEERDVASAQANCTCPYNLKYEFPLEYGDYRIRINDGNTFPFTYTSATDMTLILGDYKGLY